MNKLFAIAALSALMVGCTPSYAPVDQDFQLPPELQDCKIFQLMNSNGTFLYVTRCPLSHTTTRHSAKYGKTVAVIEDESMTNE